jgi:hypothetical protein
MNESSSESRSPALAGGFLPPPRAPPGAPLPRGLIFSKLPSFNVREQLTLPVVHPVHLSYHPWGRLEHWQHLLHHPKSELASSHLEQLDLDLDLGVFQPVHAGLQEVVI